MGEHCAAMRAAGVETDVVAVDSGAGSAETLAVDRD